MGNVPFLCYKIKFHLFLTMNNFFWQVFFLKIICQSVFLAEKLIKLNPYCLIITTFTNTVMAQQSTILRVSPKAAIVC